MKTIQKLIILMLFISSYALSVTLNSTGIYAPNKNIQVQINNQAADNKNWIGIYPRGSSNAWGNVITWEWTEGKDSVDMGGLANGSYEARLFYNNSFNLEATTPIVVDDNAARVKTTKAVYGVNENIEVDTRKFPNELEVWVGIYPAGSSNDWGNVLDWSWAQDEKIIMDALPKGNYEVRLFFHNSFKLEASYGFEVGDNTPQIHTTSAQYTVNEKISVVVNGARAGQKDWVGVFSKNDNNSWANVYAWSFVENGTTVLDRFVKKMPAGDYEIRLFFNNEYGVDAEVRASYRFKITGGANNDKVYPPETTLISRVTDDTVHKPTVGNPTIDPVFNTRISMVHKSDTFDSPYPKIQAWNSDMSLVRIKFRLYNANTLEESPITKGLPSGGHTSAYNKLCAPLNSDFRWSTKDPNKFYVLNSSLQLIEGHIIGNTTICNTVLFDFKNNGFEQANIGPGEGNIDFNDQYIVFPVKKIGDSKIYIFLYDLKNKMKVWNSPKLYNADGAGWVVNGRYWEPTVLDWVSMSPSGKYIVINDSDTGMYRYNIHFQDKRKLYYRDDNGEITSQGGHGDIGFDTNGNEVLVQFMSGQGVHSFNLDNPDELGKELLVRANGGGFVSCRNKMHRGWCYVTTRTEGFQEIYALKLDGTSNQTVQRFTQTHGNYYGGTVSPDGTKVMFSNKWNTDTLDTFIAEAK